MRVKCKHNRLKEEFVGKFSFLGPDFNTFDFKIGQEFTVLGLSYHSICPIVEIYNGGTNPSSVPLFMFEVMDDTLSKYWKVKYNEDYKTLRLEPEIFYDEYFADRLSDQVPEVEKAFFEIYDLLVKEDESKYLNPEHKYAEAIGDNWVLCPECYESFQIDSNIGVIQCPNITCKIKYNNPNFKLK